MQSDAYFFTRLDKADELFEFACEQLRKWRDGSSEKAEFLVRLISGSVGIPVAGEEVRSYKGIVGGA